MCFFKIIVGGRNRVPKVLRIPSVGSWKLAEIYLEEKGLNAHNVGLAYALASYLKAPHLV